MSEYDFSNFDDFDSGLAVAEPDEVDAPAEEAAVSETQILVVDTDSAVRDYLSGLVPQGAIQVEYLTDAEVRLSSGSYVVLLGPSCSNPESLDRIEGWTQTYPRSESILITPELTTQLLHKALRVGVKDVVSAPIDQDQLLETIDRIIESIPAETLAPASGGGDRFAEQPDMMGRVISVFSTKGGSGKSVTATNLAVALAKRTAQPVVLVDGHLQFGDVAVMLKLFADSSVADAISQLDVLDQEMLEDLMTEHAESGLRVLPAPTEPTFADQVSGEQMAQLMDVLRKTSAYVIVDLPAIFNEVVLNTIESSDDIILVAGLDIPNIKNVKIGLSTLSMLNIPKERLHLLLNRADSKVKLDVSEVERSLGVDTVAHVPSDVVVPISVNRGSPVVLSAPRSSVARAFEQLAERFMDASAGAAPQSQGRRKFFG